MTLPKYKVRCRDCKCYVFSVSKRGYCRSCVDDPSKYCSGFRNDGAPCFGYVVRDGLCIIHARHKFLHTPT